VDFWVGMNNVPTCITWYLVPAANNDGGVDHVLLEAVGVSKTGADDVMC
jgi:hypothetical protein